MSAYHEGTDGAEGALVTLLASVASVANETPSRFTVEDIKAARRSRSSRGARLAYRRPAWAWLAVLVAFAAVLVLGFRVLPSTKPNGSRPTVPATRTTGPSRASGVTTVSLPSDYWFNEITVGDGRLLLSGEVPAVGNSSAVCVVATLEPQTLRLEDLNKGSCDDPATLGETAAVVTTNLTHSNNARVSIARIDPRTGKVSVGPSVMTYASLSDTRPVIVYGGGWLWIYDVDTTKGPELLQISTSSGRVADTVTMPQLYRPILAADDDGLWIGNSVEGSPSPYVLYHVLPGSGTATGVIGGGSLNAFWLDASGDTLWAGIGPNFDEQSIWRFDGSAPRPVFRVADHGYDPTAVLGNEADGLWTVVPYPALGTRLTSGPYPEDVVRIDPDSGAEKVVATLPRMVLPSDDAGLTTGQAAYFEGSLFVLEPPFRANGYLGYGKLIRVSRAS